ncbi:hypothetical protein GSI_06938 [Ganoderma sinense ZZ0214-1]|uniref:HNH nuclease domain-containing protein n=1 Tax=Ganoderma sinense ZZ0214-1 TaxID=1077348 RepID=A0A2G8SAI7_9APHY|nr:hypothetical protein GSI_06938 [Ganoderma sinense ZZ0214-1]
MMHSNTLFFGDTFTRDLDLLVRDSSLSDSDLYNDAKRHLQVLVHPSFADIDQPAWVRRIQPFYGFSITYSSSKLFDALYQTADELGLASGKRYVSAAVCLCARRTETEAAASLEDASKRKAEALSQLASEWIAFMLWPFFIEGNKVVGEFSEQASYYELPPEQMPSQNRNGRLLVDSEHLLKRCGYTCFMTGAVHNCAPSELLAELFDGPGLVHISNLYVAQIFRPPSATGERGIRDEDETITSDILRHFCYPFHVDGIEVIKEGVTEARNSLVMSANACMTFNSFRWCLHPTPVPNQYHINVYQRNWVGTQYVASPVTFKDLSSEYSSKTLRAPTRPFNFLEDRNPTRPPCAHDLDLPSADLLRVHAALTGVLQLSGVITAFDAIRASLSFAKSCIPGASGSAFLESVVAYEGREVCAEVEEEMSVEEAVEDSD